MLYISVLYSMLYRNGHVMYGICYVICYVLCTTVRCDMAT